MKVIFFSHTAKMGGAEQSLIDLALNLKSEKKVLLLDDGPLVDTLSSRGVECKTLKREEKRGRLWYFNLFYLLRTFIFLRCINEIFKDDVIVYANSNKAYMLAWLTKLVFRRRYPIVWHLRDSFDSYHFGLARYILCFSTNFLNVNIVSNSIYTKDCFLKSLGTKRASVIYNGFDISKYTYKPKEKKGREIVMVSRISPWKGQLEVIDAIASIGGGDISLTICGAPLFGEDEYLQQLKLRVEELGLQSNIHFLGHVDNIPNFLSQGKFDLMVHSSTSPEPFGRCIVESMLSGIPVLASGIGGVPEILNDNNMVLGYMFDPLVKGSLEKELTKALDCNLKSCIESERSRASCADRFSYSVLNKNINDYIAQI